MHREHGEVPEAMRSHCDPDIPTRNRSKVTPKKLKQDSIFGEGKGYSDVDSDYGGSGMTSDEGGSGGNKGGSEGEEGVGTSSSTSASAVKVKATIGNVRVAVRRQKRTMLVAAALTEYTAEVINAHHVRNQQE